MVKPVSRFRMSQHPYVSSKITKTFVYTEAACIIILKGLCGICNIPNSCTIWCHQNSWSWFWLRHESKDNFDAEDLGMFGCYAASFGEWFPTFWRNVVSSSSGSWSPIWNSWIVWPLKTYALHFFWNVVNRSSGKTLSHPSKPEFSATLLTSNLVVCC